MTQFHHPQIQIQGMERWRRFTLLFIGLMESLLFSGIIFGWASLLYILQEEGVYSHLCNDETASESRLLHGQNFSVDSGSENISLVRLDLEAPTLKCSEQANEFTLVYTVAATMYGLTSILIGFSLDHFGLWATRLCGSFLTATGFFCLTFTTKETPWLLWPATNLISLGTNQLKLCTYQFTNLWPSRRSTVLFSYGSGFAISTTVFTLLQYLYTSGFSYRALTLPLGILSLITIPTTFLMPVMKVHEYVKEKRNEKEQATPVMLMSDEQSRQEKKFLTKNTEKTEEQLLKPSEVSNIIKENETEDRFEVPLSSSLFSVSAVLHFFWHFVNFFMILFYSVSFNAWMYKSTSDSNQVAFYTEIMGLCQLIGPIFIPITGMFTDSLVNRANKCSDPVERLALTLRAPTFANVIATVFLMGLVVCKMFVDKSAIYISMFVVAISRPLVHSSCTSYLRIRFPEEHFNRLNGIFTTLVAVIMFVQYPIFVWMFSSDENYITAHWVLVFALLVSLVSPGHLMIKKIARKYAKKHLNLTNTETR